MTEKTPSKLNNKQKGNKGEDLACSYLEKQGLKILERNWRYSRYGEIDIIATDKDTLCFIEVKTRTTKDFGHPFEAINQKKLNQIRSIAQAYINQNNSKYNGYRFDAIAVVLKSNEIEYLKDVF